MIQTKQRTRLLAIVLALVAVASIVALSLSLRAQAADREIFNVYVGDAADAKAFAEANKADTGIEAHPFSDTTRHQVVADTAKAMTALGNTKNAMKSAVNTNLDNLQVNVWILMDVTVTHTGSAILGGTTELRLPDGSGYDRDIMVNIIGVKNGDGAYPTITSETANAHTYFYTATTLKNVTINLTKGDAIYCRGHEFVADTGSSITSKGAKLPLLIASSYDGGQAFQLDTYNGIGEYNKKYVEGSFAGKITLKSGEWSVVGAAVGHPGVSHQAGATNADASYDFTNIQKADYIINIEGGTVATLTASKSETDTSTKKYTSFVGGPGCTITYNLKGGKVSAFHTGYTNKVGNTLSTSNGAYMGAYQYYNIVVNTYTGADVNLSYMRFADIVGDATFKEGTSTLTDIGTPLIAFGDLTLNFYGGTIRGNSLRMQGAVQTPPGKTAIGVVGKSLMLGKLTMTWGDPETGSVPTFYASSTSQNTRQTSFSTTVGLGTSTAVSGTGQFLNWKVYPTDNETIGQYIIPPTGSENMTLKEYADAHAAVEFNYYGANFNTATCNNYRVCMAAVHSQGTTVNVTGGNLDTLDFDLGFGGGDGNTAAGVKINMTGGTIGTFSGPNRAGTTAGATSIAGDVSFSMSGDATIENFPYLLSGNLGHISVLGNLNILMKDQAQIKQFGTFLLSYGAAGTKNVTIGGAYADIAAGNIGERAKGGINFTIQDDALIQRTITEKKTWTHSVDEGIYLFGGCAPDVSGNWVTYCLGDVNMDFAGGAIRCINDYNAASVIFMGGVNLVPKGDVKQTFRNGAKIEVLKGETATSVGACSGIYTACNSTTWANNYEVVLEDCTFEIYDVGGVKKPVYFSGKTLTGIFGSRTNTVGTPDGKRPVFKNVSSAILNSGWGQIGNGTNTFPTANRSDVVVTNTIYDIEIDSTLLLTQNTITNDGKDYSFIDGSMKTDIYGGNVGELKLTNTISMVYGDITTTITGGEFGSIFVGQCRGTNTVDIDLGKVKADRISCAQANVPKDGTGKASVSVKGDLDLTIKGLDLNVTDCSIISANYGGNVRFHWDGGQSKSATGATAGGVWQVVNGATLDGDLTYEATNVHYFGTFTPTYGTVTVKGNIKNILSGCTVDSNFYGAGTACTVNGSVTNTVKDGTILTGRVPASRYYGGNQTKVISGVITNNIEELTVVGNFYGGNGGNNNTTVACGGVVNNIQKLTTQYCNSTYVGNFYGGSEHGTINGDVVNTLNGASIQGNFYGGSAHAATNSTGRITGSVTNTLTDSATASFYGGSNGAAANATYVDNGVVNIITNLTLVTNTANGESQTTFYGGGNYAIVGAGADGVAVKTTIRGMTGDCGISVAGNSCRITGNVTMEAWNVNMCTASNSRHIVVGNMNIASGTGATPTYYYIDGDVEATFHDGAYGTVYMNGRSTVANDVVAANEEEFIKGDAIINIYGGTFYGVYKGFKYTSNADKKTREYPINIQGESIVNIYTTEADVAFRTELGTLYAGNTPIDQFNLIAGEYTLTKMSRTAEWEFNSLTGGTLNFAATDGDDWAVGKIHLTIKGGDYVSGVNVISGPTSTLKGELKDGNSIWTTVSYAIDSEEDFSRSIVLGYNYTIRYLLNKEQIDFLGKDNLTITYTRSDKTGETFDVTLENTFADGEYYYFLVDGIYAGDYKDTTINVTVEGLGKTFTLEDTIAAALEDLKKNDEYDGLGKAIEEYSEALSVWFKQGSMDGYEITMDDEVSAWVEETLAEMKPTTGAAELQNNIKAYGVNLTTTDVITINFWLKFETPVDKNYQLSDDGIVPVLKRDGQELPITGQGTRPSGADNPEEFYYYTVSYKCGAGDLDQLLELSLGGENIFKACPLTYAKALQGVNGYETLAQAIMQYAFYVSQLPQD